jgi:hypothetical protein
MNTQQHEKRNPTPKKQCSTHKQEQKEFQANNEKHKT